MGDKNQSSPKGTTKTSQAPKGRQKPVKPRRGDINQRRGSPLRIYGDLLQLPRPASFIPNCRDGEGVGRGKIEWMGNIYIIANKNEGYIFHLIHN